jgi:hypothetical protein
MFSLAGINWIAVIVGVVVSNALGFLWYGPFFAETWMKAIGKRREELQANPAQYLVTIVGSLITMVVLAAAVGAFGASGVVQGAILGAVLWVGIGGVSGYVSNLFEGRNAQIWAINSGYNLVIFVIMGAVFAAWG